MSFYHSTKKSKTTGYVYTKALIKNAFENFVKKINEGEVVTELSHKITAVNLTDEGINADIEVLDTEKGNLYKQLFDNGIELKPVIKVIGLVDCTANKLKNIKEIVSIGLVVPEECPFNSAYLKLTKK